MLKIPQAQLERVRDELTLQNLTLKSQLSDMRIRLSEIPASPPDSGIDPDASGTSSSSSTSSIPISPRPVSSTNNSKAKRYATYKKAQLERVRDELTLQNLTLKSQLSDMRIRLSEIPASPPDSGIDPDASGTSSSSSTSSIPISPRPVSSTNNSKAKRYATYKKQESIFSGDLKNMRLLIASSKRNESELKKRIHEYHNEVQDLKGKIRVFCRVKPLQPAMGDGRAVVMCRDLQSLSVAASNDGSRRSFSFDRVFGPNDGQDTVFCDVRGLIQSAVDGYNVCICAYGQTGSGKTHTMLGDDANPGIAPRAFDELFRLIRSSTDRWHCSVSAVMLELYQDRLIDLLRPSVLGKINDGSRRSFSFDRVFGPNDGQDTVFCDVRGLIQSAVDGYNVCICAYGQTGSGKTHTMLGDDANPGIAPRSDSSVPRLEIKRDAGGLVHVAGACVQPVASATELRQLFHEGAKGRHRGTTRMNVDSSRSHLVLSLLVETRSRLSGATLRGKLSLIDLAGSERVSKSGAISCGTLLKEAASINRSLFALGDVIAALVADAPHIPYRNSKLTSLMQDCLGGRAKTLMIINVSAAACNLDETISSLILMRLTVQRGLVVDLKRAEKI
ncbi:unnamed protein product [Notodromas monacha]|uniref:Kinesin-like protein n=1 Tax=Notodromas monacha TaxID=399045 RepID=A0A7R9BYG8_9CRUS|nr:unnamed protein product [Notodromas monacha]CAG0922997.1 unnamed protein product [Notodromas monacha]